MTVDLGSGGNLNANLFEMDTGKAASGVIPTTFSVAPTTVAEPDERDRLPSSTADTDFVIYLIPDGSGYHSAKRQWRLEIGGNMTCKPSNTKSWRIKNINSQ